MRVKGLPVTLFCFLAGLKQRCVKFTVVAVISLLLLLLLAGILLGYYCERRILSHPFSV